MHLQILIAILAIASISSVSLNAQAQTTQDRHSTPTNVFNITVNCANNSQQLKHLRSHNTAVNLTIACSGSGGQGQRGPPGVPGKNGQNATITIETTNGTVISTGSNSSTNSINQSSGRNILSPPLIH